MTPRRVVAISVAVVVALIGAALHARLARGDNFIRMKIKQPAAAWHSTKIRAGCLPPRKSRPSSKNTIRRQASRFGRSTSAERPRCSYSKEIALLPAFPASRQSRSSIWRRTRLAGQIPLEGDRPLSMCCSKVDNPFIYVCGSPQSPASEELLQVDVRARKS